MRRFRECIALRDWINASDEDLAEECLALMAMEAELMALPTRSVQDLAAKVAAWNCYLDQDSMCVDSSDDQPVAAEIRALVGL